ncbi:MAG: cupin domain-containing protein [Bacteroidota bacterium]
MEVQASKEYLFDKEIEWETVAPGLKRKIMGYDDKLMMVRVAFETGTVAPVHGHFHSQTTYVVSGKFEMEIDGAKKIIEAGDGFYIPPHILHGAVCLEAGELIDTFSPVRADFLD